MSHRLNSAPRSNQRSAITDNTRCAYSCVRGNSRSSVHENKTENKWRGIAVPQAKSEVTVANVVLR